MNEHGFVRREQGQRRIAVGAMAGGLVLTVGATVVPYVTDALPDHLRAGYPSYTEARIDTAVTTWLVILTAVGALGVLGWLGAIRLVVTGARSAPWVAAAMLVTAVTIALICLLVKDTSGDTGLPPSLGWLGLLPCIPGLLAVALLLKRS